MRLNASTLEMIGLPSARIACGYARGFKGRKSYTKYGNFVSREVYRAFKEIDRGIMTFAGPVKRSSLRRKRMLKRLMAPYRKP